MENPAQFWVEINTLRARGLICFMSPPYVQLLI